MTKKLHNVPHNETINQYNVSVKVYGNGTIQVKHFNKDIQYQQSGFEEKEKVSKFDTDIIKKQKKLVNKVLDDNQVIRSDSLHRSYTLLMDLALNNANEFKSFITLTFRDNVSDLSFTNYEFNKWVKRVKYIYPDFIYLCVPEFQKRGAIHYHLLTNLIPDVHFEKRERLSLWSDSTKKYKEVDYYDIFGWSVDNSLGYSSAYDLSLTDDNFSAAAYLSKYFFKDIGNRLWGRRKILYSRGLKKPSVLKLNYGTNEYYNYIAYLESRTELLESEEVIPKRKYGVSFLKETYKER